jgi:hypothetical protein
MYRICCPYCYKKQLKKKEDEEAERRKSAESDIRRPSRKSVAGGDHIRFSTIGQLTNAVVVTEPPPPVFAKFMLRKSVDRLNTEV